MLSQSFFLQCVKMSINGGKGSEVKKEDQANFDWLVGCIGV